MEIHPNRLQINTVVKTHLHTKSEISMLTLGLFVYMENQEKKC